jgi:hypothetical protein
VSTSSGKGRPGLKATKPNMDLKINNFWILFLETSLECFQCDCLSKS